MKSNKIVKSVGGAFNKVGFQLRKKSPEILMVTGIVGFVATAVMACKATTKATAVASETKTTLRAIREAKEEGATVVGEPYSEDDYRKDLNVTHIQTGVKFVKLYGPVVLLGVGSAMSIIASHNIMKKRNVALVAAYTAMDKSFKGYRDRVAERVGDQVEKELRYGVKAQEVEKTVTDDKGKEKTVKEEANVIDIDPTLYSPYAKIFDETHPDWIDDAEQNMFYLKARQSQANDMLKARGHLFLNEVYDLLGFERTKAGAIVGWVYDPKCPKGDNYIDFGLFDIRRPKARDFVNGYESAVVLDFNVVGDILDDIATHQNLWGPTS